MRSFENNSMTSLAARLGALCYDHTFTRVLGTRGASEPILKDLVAAWNAARAGGAVAAAATAAAGDSCVEELSILDRKVLVGTPPRGRGELLVDVRLRGAEGSMIVEVQHRVEQYFPRRALLYASADFLLQHKEDVASDSPMGMKMQRPVHTLAFCDFDFVHGRNLSGIGASRTSWRSRAGTLEPRHERALHSYCLLPSAGMALLGQAGNAALDDELASRMSFTFALLPHAPRLEDLTASTPPLLRWASLVAHVAPYNLNSVPKAVRSEGVNALIQLLSDTESDTEAERLKALEEERQTESAVESALVEGREEGRGLGREEGRELGREEGETKGREQGREETLRSLGIESIADFKAKFGGDPPASLSAFLRR